MSVTINNQPVVLKGKADYTFVDIFDFYPFDLSSVRGTRLITNINGQHAEFIASLQDGDTIDIYWEK